MSILKKIIIVMFLSLNLFLLIFQFSKIEEKNKTICNLQSKIIQQEKIINDFDVLSNEDLFFIYYLKTYFNLTTALAYKYTYLISDYCDMMKIDKWIVFSQIQQESQYKYFAVGSAGEIGLSQILPSTANYILSFSNLSKLKNKKELFSPDINIFIEVKYLSLLGDNIVKSLLCYNQGNIPQNMTYYQIRNTRYVSGIFNKTNLFKKEYENIKNNGDI